VESTRKCIKIHPCHKSKNISSILKPPPQKNKPIKSTFLKSKENEIIIFDILQNSQNDILKDNENHETIIQKINQKCSNVPLYVPINIDKILQTIIF
jgi:hypothetical protein